jgi:3-hydroxyacyl-CoA dehydrogenase
MKAPVAMKKVAVIGAGVMGAGIAAHMANAGVPVLLLDIVPEGAKDRNAVAKGALEKLKKANPAALMHAKNVALMTPGNIEDDLPKLKDCDWVIEAVIERLDIKRALYRKLVKHIGKETIVSSNTSTLPLDVLLEGLPLGFKKHFMITHFFNPPRYMRLLELVVGKDTLPGAARRVEDFADHMLGKSVVRCYDRPGFIANRVGTYWMFAAMVMALKHGVEVEEADAILSRPAGVPKTGVFGLMDLVGLDLMPHIIDSMNTALPEKDAFRQLGAAPKLLGQMLAEGLTGRKGKGGFYRLTPDKKKEVMNLHKGSYVPVHKQKYLAVEAAKKGGLKALLTNESSGGRYAWDVLGGMMEYAASLVGEIAADIEMIDRAMRLGFNWKAGPFEMIDKLGTAWFTDQLRARGRAVPKILQVAKGRPLYRVAHGRLEFMKLHGHYAPVKRPDGVLLLEDIKRYSKPIMKNGSASVWDIGDEVACFEFHSKMNSLNPFIISLLRKALRELPKRGTKALVIYNEGSNFSVGANILMLLITSKLHLWPLVRWILWDGQKTYGQVKYSKMPVVGAPAGMALGGGCEILLHCHAVEAHAETYMGLVEAGVGIVPGWGGCKELLGRAIGMLKAKGPMPAVAHAFETIATAKVSKSAREAKDLLFLRPDDGIVMNRDRLLAAAKARALKLALKHKVEEPHVYGLPGPSGFTALRTALHDFVLKGLATPHDVVVGTALARVLTGGDTDITRQLSEDDMLKLERDGLVSLAKTRGTRARIAHMLKTGKPLRN